MTDVKYDETVSGVTLMAGSKINISHYLLLDIESEILFTRRFTVGLEYIFK